MRKNVRKMIALMLSLVLMCLCATAAFAASWSGSEDYEGYQVVMTREINKYNVKGSIEVEDDGGLLRRVSIDVWYITEDSAGNAVTMKFSSPVAGSTERFTGVAVEKTWTSAEISNYNITCLSYSNTTYKAEVYARGTIMTYNSGACYLAYLLQN